MMWERVANILDQHSDFDVWEINLDAEDHEAGAGESSGQQLIPQPIA